MKLATHPAKRLDVFVEAPALQQVIDAVEQAGVTGYTVLPALQGKGHHGVWHRDDSFNNASHVVCLTCITSESRAEAAVEALQAIVRRQIAILTLSDVTVVRPDHF